MPSIVSMTAIDNQRRIGQCDSVVETVCALLRFLLGTVESLASTVSLPSAPVSLGVTL